MTFADINCDQYIQIQYSSRLKLTLITCPQNIHIVKDIRWTIYDIADNVNGWNRLKNVVCINGLLQHLIRYLIVRSRVVSKPRIWLLKSLYLFWNFVGASAAVLSGWRANFRAERPGTSKFKYFRYIHVLAKLTFEILFTDWLVLWVFMLISACLKWSQSNAKIFNVDKAQSYVYTVICWA